MPGLALALSLFVLSQAGLLVKLAHAGALDIGLWRMVIAVPLLVLLGAYQGKIPEIRALKSSQVRALAFCGLFLFLHWWSWFLSVQRTTLANAMVLFAISPLFTAVGAWKFFGERFTRRHAVALLLCFGGVVCVFRHSLNFAPENLGGDALGLLSSILFSSYVLVGKGIRQKVTNIPFTVVTYSFCGAYFAAMLLFQGDLKATFPASTWGIYLLLALGPTILGHALFTYCLQFFSVNLMNILLLTEPLFGMAVAYLVLGEGITFAVLVGFAFICLGISVLFAPRIKI